MSTQPKAIQDTRSASRVMAELDCRFTFEGVSHEAVLRDISLSGAFLWSTFVPTQGGDVFVRLETPLLKSALTLKGKVVRTECPSPRRPEMNAFAIQFGYSPSELIVLISKLVSRNFSEA